MTATARLAGKRTLVTAAGQGIGRASAELYARVGAEVIACDINEATLAELAKIPNVTPIKLDVTDVDAVPVVVSEAGPLDV